MGLSKFLYLSGFELADIGDEGVFAEVHLMITKYDKTICINSEEIFSGEVKLHSTESVGLE